MFLLQIMLGTWTCGLEWGRKLGKGQGKAVISTVADPGWFSYTLPRPRYGAGTVQAVTCMICLVQFLVDPLCMAIQAFNQGGRGWNQSGPLAPHSSIIIGPDANGLWTAITCNNRDEQERLRLRDSQQVGSRRILGAIGDLLLYSEKNAEQKINRRTARGGGGGAAGAP